MTIRLITGPPGAGKNTYIEKHKKDGDFVFDWDVLAETYPHMTRDQLKAMRETIYGSLQTLDRDAWVIQCVAPGEKRTEIAQKIGADEVVVLETDAETAKARVKERGRNPERNQEVFDAIDQWWSQYGVVASDVIVRPDTGQHLSDRKKNMGDTENEKSGPETDKGFPAETKIADMTAEEQAAYWKFQSRKHESEKNRLRAEKDNKDNGQGQSQQQSPNPPAGNAPIDAAELRKQILAELKREQAPTLVRSKFESLIGDRLSATQRDAILEDLDFNKFVSEDGSIDADKIKTKAEAIAPADSQSSGSPRRRTHQGPRRQEASASVQSGRDLFEATQKKGRN